MAGPRNGIKTLDLDFLVAGHAVTVGAVLEAIQRLADRLQGKPVVIALVKQKLLGVGVRGLIRYVLGAFFVGFAAILVVLRDLTQQFVLFFQEAFPVNFCFPFIHTRPLLDETLSSQT